MRKVGRVRLSSYPHRKMGDDGWEYGHRPAVVLCFLSENRALSGHDTQRWGMDWEAKRQRCTAWCTFTLPEKRRKGVYRR